MSDQLLLSFGAAATFITACGFYVYVRALFTERTLEPVRSQSRPREKASTARSGNRAA